MKADLSTDDLKGLPHLVILKSETELKVLQFEGENGMEQAHEVAQNMALKNWPGCIIVCARVRTLCPMKYEHLMP